MAFASCETEDSPSDQSIILAIDVSSSVDRKEMEIQMGAYEQALSSQEVKNQLLGCGCTEVAVILFGHQSRVAYEPTNMVTEDDIHKVASYLSGLKNNSAPLYDVFELGGQTNVVSALRTSIDAHLSYESTSFRKVILISGDGVNSTYAENKLNDLKEEVRYHGIEVNAIPIVVEDGQDLVSYYDDLDFQPMLPSGGGRGMSPPMSARSAPSGIRYESLEEFYRQLVISEYGALNTANSFQDLEPVLTESLKELACQLIM